jgi:hypothetical protein
MPGWTRLATSPRWVVVVAERRHLDPYPLAGYTWSTWLAPAYRPNPEADSVTDPPAGRGSGRGDESDDSQEVGEEK